MFKIFFKIKNNDQTYNEFFIILEQERSFDDA